jgi:hypothetical protein
VNVPVTPARRAFAAALTAILLAGTLAGAASAGKSTGGIKTFVRQITLQAPVEYQTPGGATQPDRSLWVTNPTTCGWDIDDIVNISLSGDLAPGASFTYQSCIVADWARHAAGIWLNTSGKLRLTITVDGVHTASSMTDRVRIDGPEFDSTAAALQPIAGSNGGVGKVVPVVFTITNVGSQRVSKILGELGIRDPNTQAAANWAIAPLECHGRDPKVCS